MGKGAAQSDGYKPMGRAESRSPAPDRTERETSGLSTASNNAARLKSLNENADVVQFTSSVYYCMEDAGYALIDVMRIGPSTGESSVAFRTEDSSAVSGQKYTAKSGRVVFGPGEVLKSLEIAVKSDDFFDTTTEFKVHLEDPDHCFLGVYLQSARVFIIDDDIFPSNDFKAEVARNTEEALAEVSISLLVAYIRFTMLRVPSIWWKTILTALLDQLSNVYYLLTIYIQVYLVDVVLNIEEPTTLAKLWIPNNRYATAFLLAVLYFSPNFILLVAGQIKRTYLDMSKPIRVHLQINLFRKYLNFTEESKQAVPIQDLTTAMDAEIPMLVEDGFMFIFNLAQGLGKVSVVAGFMLLQDPRCLVPLVVYPVIMLAFIRKRQERFVELEGAMNEAEAGGTGMLVNSVEGFALIRDYRKRDTILERYEMLLGQCTKCFNEMAVFMFWNERLVPWLQQISIGAYMALGAQEVLLGHSSVGAFLAMIGVLNELGDRFGGLYDDLQAGVQAGSPLVSLTRMMNFPTDVKDRLTRNRMRRAFMKDRVEAMIREEGLPATNMRHKLHHSSDEVAQKMEGVHVSFFDRLPLHLDKVSIPYIKALREVDVEVSPGTLVYATGPHSTGKGTLMRVLTDVVLPTQGNALFSSHYRCLYVSSTPEVMPYLSLYENLTFGVAVPNPVRVKSIFSRLGLGHGWLAHQLDVDIAQIQMKAGKEKEKSATKAPDGDTSNWNLRLSDSERKAVHLARAFIFNPELFIAARPLEECDADDIENISKMFREFVDHRGVGMPLDTIGRRRPRICIISGGMNPGSQIASEFADVVWYIDNDSGLKPHKGGSGHYHHLPHFSAVEGLTSGVASVGDALKRLSVTTTTAATAMVATGSSAAVKAEPPGQGAFQGGTPRDLATARTLSRSSQHSEPEPPPPPPATKPGLVIVQSSPQLSPRDWSRASLESRNSPRHPIMGPPQLSPRDWSRASGETDLLLDGRSFSRSPRDTAVRSCPLTGGKPPPREGQEGAASDGCWSRSPQPPKECMRSCY